MVSWYAIISDRDTDPSEAILSNRDPCSRASGRVQLLSVETSMLDSACPKPVLSLTFTSPVAFR